MGQATAVGIAILAGVLATALARRARCGPPAWVLGVGVAGLVCLIAASPQTQQPSSQGMVAKLRVVDADGANLRHLADLSEGIPQLSWSPDGKEIAITDTMQSAMVLVSLDTGVVRRLPLQGWPGEACSWSPDGTRIVYPYGTSSSRDFIGILDVQTGKCSQLGQVADNYVAHVAWSPDGARIAWAQWAYPNVTVEIMNTDGSGRAELARYDGGCNGLQWRPDDSGLLSLTHHERALLVHEIDLDGTVREVLELGQGGYAILSPDCSKLATKSIAPSGMQFGVVDLAGGLPRRFNLPRAAGGTEIAWSADGRTFAVSVALRTHAEIWLVEAVSGVTWRVATAGMQFADLGWEGPVYRQLLDDWRLIKEPWFWQELVGNIMSPSHDRMPMAVSIAVAPDGGRVAFVDYTRVSLLNRALDATTRRARFVLALLLGPLAFIWGIVAWRRQGRSTVAILCVVTGLLPALIATVRLVLFLIPGMTLGPF